MPTRYLYIRFSFVLLFTALFLTAKSQSNAPQNPNDFRVMLESGTAVFLETNNEMSTKYLEFGMNICLYLKFPVKVNGFVILPAGTPAFCRISRLEKPSGFGKAGLLEIEPLYLQNFKGDIFPIGSQAQIMSSHDRSSMANSMGLIGSSLGQLAMLKSASMPQSALPMSMPMSAPAPMPEPVAMMGSIPVYDQFSQPNALMSKNSNGPNNALNNVPNNDPMPVPPSDNGTTRSMNILNKVVGVTQVAAAIVPVVAFLIKGKHAKLPKGYIVKTQLISNTVVVVGD